MIRATISCKWTGTGVSAKTVVPSHSLEDLLRMGWKITAVKEERLIDKEKTLLTWGLAKSPEGDVLYEGGSSGEVKEELDRLVSLANQALATTEGKNDPFRPALDKYKCSWGDQTNLPVAPIPDPNIALVDVYLEEAVLAQMETDGIVIWYSEKEEKTDEEVGTDPKPKATKRQAKPRRKKLPDPKAEKPRVERKRSPKRDLNKKDVGRKL